MLLAVYILPAGLYSLYLERAFFYVPRPLIDGAPRNDALSLTTYTMHIRTSIYSSKPWESNYRDGPTGHKNN